MGKANWFILQEMFNSLLNIRKVRTKMIKVRLLDLLLPYILLTFIYGCGMNDNHKYAFFHPDNLLDLELLEINGFWNDVSMIDTSFGGGPGVLFEMQPGFLDGIGVYDDDQMVWVNVFSSTDTAIYAMESRIANVSAIIQRGTTDEVKGTWWFLNEGWNYSVYVNKWNTIVEVTIFNVDEEETEKIYNAVNVLARRVEKLSD